ncbi:hypothetical protein ACG2E4_18495, partial [Halalkalibaculum sp. DA384]
MQTLDIQYLRDVNSHKNTLRMHDLKTNFDKILPIVNETLADFLNSDLNVQFYPNKPRMPDAHIISLALLQEALGIDSEHWFWSKLQADYSHDFSTLPHLSCYNRRRRRLAGWIEKLARLWGRHICPYEDTYMVDSIPVPVAHIAREHSTAVCREHFHSAPDKGYSAITDQYYI